MQTEQEGEERGREEDLLTHYDAMQTTVERRGTRGEMEVGRSWQREITC